MSKKNILKIIPTKEVYNKSIVPSSLNLPDWYINANQYIDNETILRKDLPSSTNGTFRICSPFLDSLTSGYMIILDADVEVVNNKNEGPYIMWRTDEKMVDFQPESSWNGIKISDQYENVVLKWISGFGLETPKGYSVLFTHPHNRTDLPFYTISGVVDTDKYNVAVNFPFLLKKNFAGIIEKGTPIVQILPFKRDDWYHEYQSFDFKRIAKDYNIFLQKIVRSYKRQYWSKKRYR